MIKKLILLLEKKYVRRLSFFCPNPNLLTLKSNFYRHIMSGTWVVEILYRLEVEQA